MFDVAFAHIGNLAPSHILSPLSLAELGPEFKTLTFGNYVALILVEFSLVSSSFLGRRSLIILVTYIHLIPGLWCVYMESPYRGRSGDAELHTG